MSRPSQLLLIALVYTLGVAIARAEGIVIDVSDAFVGFGALCLIAVSVHYANEYADYWTDRLVVRTPFSGGSGALARTGLARRLGLVGARVTLAVGVVVTAVGAWTDRLAPVAVVILALIALFGWAYSIGPALAWRGLGELDNAALGGLALPAYGYAVASGRLESVVVLACLPFALLVFANLLATQWPDRRADAVVGKDTLAVRWSAPRLRWAYLLCTTAGFGLLVVLDGGVLPSPVARSSFLALPFALWGAAWYTRRRSPVPSVAAMVVLAAVQTIGWVAFG